MHFKATKLQFHHMKSQYSCRRFSFSGHFKKKNSFEFEIERKNALLVIGKNLTQKANQSQLYNGVDSGRTFTEFG